MLNANKQRKFNSFGAIEATTKQTRVIKSKRQCKWSLYSVQQQENGTPFSSIQTIGVRALNP